ncbi:dolichyl-phosphate beta-glucosyltransferase-like [Tigriopus californicus]|uniref:dolichyl-phosphate beta-glucosyltransferase-like n=1 Tax=Tigriopus californicus TaxID=6832 RepID=UPI0027DAAD75|nr:dolichyl-phosphate beta-glucosyltransferase-like [Tigriopus californicus]
MDWMEGFLLLICLVLVAVTVVVIFVISRSQALADVPVYEGENVYLDPKAGEWHRFDDIPCALIVPGTIDLSVIVPAYNEENRLNAMMDEATQYLDARQKAQKSFQYEIIIVDDGSKDCTSTLGRKWSSKLGPDKVRVLTLARNRGKGGAVRMGMFRCRGRRCLFADADGATQFSELEKLESKLSAIQSAHEGDGIVCGSRAHMEKDSIATRSLFRTVLMHGFHVCVWFFGCQSIKDTQCGFKLMTRSTACDLFRSLHIERWAFDVELLKIAEMLKIPTAEVPVRWTEIDGSKLDPISASVQMFYDLFALWLRYRLGAWKIAKRHTK